MQLFLEDGKYILSNEGIDCSIPLSASEHNPRAWYVDPPLIEPVRANGWIGSVAEGGNVNFRNVFFNPHGHGTHTECLGHITNEVYSVNKIAFQPFYSAELISIVPLQILNEDGEMDSVITLELLKEKVKSEQMEALLIRTLPNSSEKKSKNYSDSNPPYFTTECVELLNQLGVLHLLVDTPSVDREKDNGELAFHHKYWGVPDNERFDRTITELIFVPDQAKDGLYLLNLQTAPFENDATPSRPVLFPLHSNTED
jgi:arylformamidase